MKKNLKHNVIFASISTFTPVVMYAQFSVFVNGILVTLNLVSRFLAGLALVVFIIGVIRFMYTAGDDQSRSQGKHMLVWGTIALFSMIAVWGIVRIIHETLFP